MIYGNSATTQPSDGVTAEDACSGGRTPWMFSEGETSLGVDFIFFSE